MSYRGWFLLILVSILTISANGAIAGSITETDPGFIDSTLAATGDVPVDEVLIVVSIHSDGTADWRIEYRTRLADPDLRDAFTSLQYDIDENPDSYLDPFGNWITETAAVAADFTGRTMAIESLHIEAETRLLPQEYGVVTYRFTWIGFAHVEGSTISIGDAITGFFLDAYTRLRVHWPQEYQYQTASPTPDEIDETSLTWYGPVDFTGEQPRVTIGTTGVGDTISSMWYAILFAAAIVIGVIALHMRSQDRFDRIPEASATEMDTTGIDPTLMSNEERVIALLEESGGRLKQREIGDHLNWTDAKTSTVVKQLREDNLVVVFRLGRENVVSLAAEDEGI